MLLKNKNILITGASRGIGRALAIELAKKENNLCLFARNEELLLKLKNELNQYNSNVLIFRGDTGNIQDVEKCIELIKRNFKTLDLAILNAGIGLRLDSKDFNYEANRNVFETNFFGVMNFLKYLIPMYKEQGYGIISGISSLADVRGFPLSAAYSASKAALTTYLEAIRIELKPVNIKVITIRPGFVDTDMIKNNKFKMLFILSPEEAAKVIINKIEKEKSVINFPVFYHLLTSVTRILPDFVFNYLMKYSK